jgi:formate dehydrogenase gamma subunit
MIVVDLLAPAAVETGARADVEAPMKSCPPSVVGHVVALSLTLAAAASAAPPATPDASSRPAGVCPPFHLRDEQGGKIDPIAGVNAQAPYSPRQTCGATGCHDYDKITRGYHFTQGQGEAPTADQRARYAWATATGNFGGNWCSPAPLYRYLSPKQNDSAARMDMTAFDFFTSPCGTCHPGGGSAENDRDGKRYDRWMADPASGFSPGGENRFDGDYYKARWSETGVLEADCLLCHFARYDFGERQAQLGRWNLRWAATAGARLATVTGSVKDGKAVEVAYDPGRFEPDGSLRLSLTRQPRDEACLSCHAQPGWKKRGANYRARTDVHLRAGLKCVDCHPAGRSALDPRISDREEHQIAKGDDPGGLVRNDLDDTVVACAECHDTGRRGAPVAKHAGLPALHLERLACQACHIPERLVMPAEVQAGDVYNTSPWIHAASKRLWTFYGPDGRARNHYGFLDVMGYDDKPAEPFRPTLFRYKGKIYPGNRVHSAWPGLEIEGQDALAQPRMGDIVRMWTAHLKDPAKYPRLAAIVDDTGDGVPEVNRPEEIDALVASVRRALEDIGYPLEGTRVVWVSNERVYRSGTEYREVPRHAWEASPFANVHKYSHDVYPARAALGSGGCTDCHAPGAPFLYAAALAAPFGPDGQPERVPQWRLLGLSRAGAWLGAWRESALKPAGPWLLGAVIVACLLHLVVFGPRRTLAPAGEPSVLRYGVAERLGHMVAMASFLLLAVTGLSFLLGADSPLGATARLIHTITGFVFGGATAVLLALWMREARPAPGDRDWLRHLGGYLGFRGPLPAGKLNAGQKLYFWFVLAAGLGLGVTGILMTWPGLLPSGLAFAYTLHDLLAILVLCGVTAHFYLAVVVNPGALRGVIEGTVGATWAREHHPRWGAAPASAAPGREAPE